MMVALKVDVHKKEESMHRVCNDSAMSVDNILGLQTKGSRLGPADRREV
jgi:hypothetical protein